MDVRSRACVISTVLVVSLAAAFSVYYFALREKSGENDQISQTLQEPESSITSKTHRITGTAHDDESKETTERNVTISDYNPLEDEGFIRSTSWSKFRSHGTLSATAADFRKDEDCRRVVVFLARDVILGHLVSVCDFLDPSMGLLMVNDVLHYYGRAMEKQGPSNKVFVVAKKIPGERRCLMTNYTIAGEDSPKLEDKSPLREIGAYEDRDCKILVDFKMPPMLLLSKNGATGNFSTGKVWATINPWEPLGVATKIFWYGPRCFRLLLITSYGRSVQAVKVSCGPVENLVVTNDTLYYGDALAVRRNTNADTFILIYNPKRSGDCFKKIVKISSWEGRPQISIITKGNLKKDNEECQQLINKRFAGSSVSKEVVDQLVENLELNNFDVEPYGESLEDYDPYNHWSYFNLPLDLGVGVRYYKSKTGQSVRKLVLVVARGVPLSAVLTDPSAVQGLVMRSDVLYHNTTIMLRTTSDENKFTTLIKLDEYNCFKKSYKLINQGGISVKEELPSGGKVTKSMDEDCLNLIEGRKLKSAELGNFGHETDEIGIPTVLPPEVKIPRGA